MKNDFSSIDRLIDLGMGLAMSNQIAQSMNNMMAQISTPPQINTMYQGYAQAGMNQRPQNVAPVAPVAQTTAATVTTTKTVETKQELVQELYYALIEGKQLGPYKGTEIALLILGKKVTCDTLVWKTGTKDWVKASEYEDLKNLIDMVPPSIPEVK